MHNWNRYTSFDDASKQAAVFIADKIQSCVEAKGVCHVILPGGTSPLICFKYLVEQSLPWEKVYWYPGDERCCPVGHPDRNDLMLGRALFAPIADDYAVTHYRAMPAELGPDAGARQYTETIATIDRFDIAFLGMGEDGHTASLFPGHPGLNDPHRIIAVKDSPKPPPERVSFGLSELQACETKIILVKGEQKGRVLKTIQNAAALPFTVPTAMPATIPVTMLGDVNWFLDKEAADCLAR